MKSLQEAIDMMVLPTEECADNHPSIQRLENLMSTLSPHLNEIIENEKVIILIKTMVKVAMEQIALETDSPPKVLATWIGAALDQGFILGYLMFNGTDSLQSLIESTFGKEEK